MVAKERIAVMSDIHGNIRALDAVLEDVRGRGIEDIVNLGDSVYGPLDPAGTADLLMDSGIKSISGNQDRILFDRSEEVLRSTDHRFVLGRLNRAHLEWLDHLPSTRVLGGVLFCHGTPASDDAYLLERITDRGVVLDEDAAIRARLGGVREEVVFCGHSHVPRTIRSSDGRLVVNPGSVGLPAYTDDVPYPHAMEAGTPHARYAILSRSPRGYGVEHVLVPYPWEEAATVATRNGREDWARWIKTGRA